MSVSPSRSCRVWRLFLHGGLLLLVGIIVVFWFGRNSDDDNVPAIVRQLMPAKDCACQSATIFECNTCQQPSSPAREYQAPLGWQYDYRLHANDESLQQDQCDVAFPGLFEDPERASQFLRPAGNITRETLDDVPFLNSMTRAMIYHGRLYILASKSKAEDHRRKMLATLSAIHRALVADPNRMNLPNIEFIFSVEDMAADISAGQLPLWMFTRKATEESIWLMPDFGFWTWRNVVEEGSDEIGPYDEVVEKSRMVEENIRSANQPKIQELVWRGRLSFAPKIRRALLDESRGNSWGNVKELSSKTWQNNFLTMEDHCKYMFIAHAEGRSYSASLKYRQACRSVLIIHKLQYIQHHHYLLSSSGPQQNYVEVERDFSDLNEKMTDLLANPTKAQMIADNSVRTFRERYLTPAAEACYWRALWRAYGRVSEEADLWESRADGTLKQRALRYETFVLLESDKMLDFRTI